jgi:hypothetical protein
MTSNRAVENAITQEVMHNVPFGIRHLSVLAYAQGFTLWHYRADGLAGVKSVGYFDDARDMLAVGDIVLVSGTGGGTVVVVADVTDHVVVASLA